MIAFKELGINIESYDAFEIDKHAIKVSTHNFPEIKQHGDVFKGDFAQFEGVDWVIGGSPCTHWSIAQKKNRETTASGIGWELFQQYVRAIKEAKPKYFLYENNKSMSKEIRASITEAFGFEPVLINSALVSAQNRQRLYWVGKRNDDGTYSKVDVEQPKDRGILLKDVLDNAVAWQNKSYCMTDSCNGAVIWNTLERGQRTMVAEPVNVTIDGKARTIRATCYKDGIRNMVGNNVDRKTCVAEPVCVAQQGRYSYTEKRCVKSEGGTEQFYEARTDGKTNALTTVQKDNAVAEPVRVGCYPSPDGTLKNSQGMRLYNIEGKSVSLTANGEGVGAKTGLYAIPIVGESETLNKRIPEIAEKYGYIPAMFNAYNRAEITDKSPTLSTGSMVTSSCATTIFTFAYPIEFDNGVPIKAISGADGKTYPVYEVRNGQITIKGKQYPIKLADGYYIIRKLTVNECKRLQTVPDWYDFSVISNSQAYKCLGNGWTCDVITHLIKSALNQKTSQA